jgi:hypothetical protein
MEIHKEIDCTDLTKETFRKYVVSKCNSIREFLNQYFNLDSIGINWSEERTLNYMENYYKGVMQKDGYIALSGDFSKTGKIVAYYED